MRNIILYGGSFNPPCLHHRELVQAIAAEPFFQKVVVIPCGRRADKSYVSNGYRQQMVEHAFVDISNVVLDMRNVRDDTFTSNYHLEQLYQATDTVLWHAIGSDLLVRDEEGLNPIQRRWTKGRFIWDNFYFLVIPKVSYSTAVELLPAKNFVLQQEFIGSSTDVRKASIAGKPFQHLVDSKTCNFIVKNHLYQ